MKDIYRVQFYKDKLYEVVLNKETIITDDTEYNYHHDVVVFRGTLSDCDAWLRLNERGYI